tara:strand:+ start:301 stop:534 length:234 start_codon:yes stop_codon:yes gene_type:complete
MDIITLVKNFSKEALKFVSQGAPIVEKEVFEERLNICNKCEHLDVNKCLKCGCTMTVKCKWGTAACPINKWGAVNTK